MISDGCTLPCALDDLAAEGNTEQQHDAERVQRHRKAGDELRR